MKQKLIHSAEVVGFAALAAGASAFAEGVAAGAPPDLASENWWLHVGMGVAAAVVLAARKALAKELDPA